MAIVMKKCVCHLCKHEYEVTDTSQMTDKEYFIDFWENTIGKEAAEKSWEEKEKNVRRAAPMVASDIGGYVSQVDGSWIESRSKHRDHLKRHGMVEIGNDVPMRHKAVEVTNTEARKRQIAEQVYSKLKY
jgi:hypothetical protein